MAWFLFSSWTQLDSRSTCRFTLEDTESAQGKPVGFHSVRPGGCQKLTLSADLLGLVRCTEVLPFRRGKLSRYLECLARPGRGCDSLNSFLFGRQGQEYILKVKI